MDKEYLELIALNFKISELQNNLKTLILEETDVNKHVDIINNNIKEESNLILLLDDLRKRIDDKSKDNGNNGNNGGNGGNENNKTSLIESVEPFLVTQFKQYSYESDIQLSKRFTENELVSILQYFNISSTTKGTKIDKIVLIRKQI